ncbi:ribosomal protein S5 domain 2-like protein [Rozella allomycis CSF55]|uniref:Exoribonuclease, phosphorolytic 1 domain-containing protein n=1 Tax=Rozella allomycis (strain CSF55) TaxID=988480 RepID=A0A075AXW3_ROZAC|nr:Exoribonuclease, phosphorolytic 1 domain-containing protein [Rozella allomycis CSF55]RKP20902.1 ribosomal protein S5 domain 2-like protein [Rozella allomycis CSF55]|eukprot:EPZ33562.1 Exoribonuclease, phosphorolytic 1 domain-containing protein [Rozella allomycis CSF55]
METQVDRKRITCPEVTVAPLRREKNIPIFNSQGLRQDNRDGHTLRPLFVRTSVIDSASGSAYLECGNTKISCAVYCFLFCKIRQGPKQNLKTDTFEDYATLYCELKFAPYSCENKRSHQPDEEEKEYSKFIEDALKSCIRLDMFPKSMIDIYITVLENDGAVLENAITCASLALMDAGIDMIDMLIGSTVNFVENQIIVDATCYEEKKSIGQLSIAYLPNMNEIATVNFKGHVDANIVANALQAGMDSCSQVYTNIRQSLSL